jgi:hypothetical protein
MMLSYRHHLPIVIPAQAGTQCLAALVGNGLKTKTRISDDSEE